MIQIEKKKTINSTIIHRNKKIILTKSAIGPSLVKKRWVNCTFLNILLGSRGGDKPGGRRDRLTRQKEPKGP